MRVLPHAIAEFVKLILTVALIAVTGLDLPFGLVPPIAREGALHAVHFLEPAFGRAFRE